MDGVIPLWEILVKDDSPLLFEISGNFPPRRVHGVENADVHS